MKRIADSFQIEMLWVVVCCRAVSTFVAVTMSHLITIGGVEIVPLYAKLEFWGESCVLGDRFSLSRIEGKFAAGDFALVTRPIKAAAYLPAVDFVFLR